ncbi:NUDIX domain-containing protein [Thermaerobacter sp. PB12/4term]|uniref:NUDIX hydrolase n=1 Tax=Thermaerobacter sp. PB12/4term TaxID=2293838 RepID=UPI000E32CBD2|nr:NUDIX domain-containing protein [Thermaerobacter sp. PB12/4term]QIA27170.1 NUDIX domain-containing protein [Thermaerobacter sp. PB12/4term]
MIERQAAGGVVYRRAGAPAGAGGAPGPDATGPGSSGEGDRRPEPAVEVLMILDAYGHWALPKGGIEAGETPEAAALREIREETGIVGALETRLPPVRYRFRDGDEEVDKTVHYFLVRALNHGIRVQREELRDAQWLPLDEAIRRCTYENLVPTLEAARRELAARPAEPEAPARVKARGPADAPAGPAPAGAPPEAAAPSPEEGTQGERQAGSGAAAAAEPAGAGAGGGSAEGPAAPEGLPAAQAGTGPAAGGGEEGERVGAGGPALPGSGPQG